MHQTPARPKHVDTAFTLWIASAALSLIVGILTFVIGRDAARDGARKALEDSGGSFTENDVETAVTVAITFTAVIALIFFGLYLLFAYKMRAGRNWARIVLAILGVIGLIMSVLSLVSGGDAFSMIINVIQIALVGAAIYFMFTKEATAYFDSAKRAA